MITPLAAGAEPEPKGIRNAAFSFLVLARSIDLDAIEAQWFLGNGIEKQLGG